VSSAILKLCSNLHIQVKTRTKSTWNGLCVVWAKLCYFFFNNSRKQTFTTDKHRCTRNSYEDSLELQNKSNLTLRGYRKGRIWLSLSPVPEMIRFYALLPKSACSIGCIRLLKLGKYQLKILSKLSRWKDFAPTLLQSFTPSLLQFPLDMEIRAGPCERTRDAHRNI